MVVIFFSLFKINGMIALIPIEGALSMFRSEENRYLTNFTSLSHYVPFSAVDFKIHTFRSHLLSLSEFAQKMIYLLECREEQIWYVFC